MDSNRTQDFFNEFMKNYTKIHGKIIFILTIFGLILSILTNFILRKDYFQTTTNLIIRHIIFFRCIVLTSYNIYSLDFYIVHHHSNPFISQSILRLCFAIFHSNISLTAHSIALWLTCLLVIIRFIILSKTIVSVRDIIRLIRIIIIVTCLLMIPNYLTWKIVKISFENQDFYSISTKNSENLEKNSFIILTLCFQIVPILILIIFSILFLFNSYQSNELFTMKMIFIFISSTIFLELPRTIFFLISGIHEDFLNLYSYLGDIWDLTSISSSFIIFFTYLFMSKEFRVEIYRILFPQSV